MSAPVAVGQVLADWVIDAVSAEKMKTFAPILADSNPIHFDTRAVERLGMGNRPINQGPSNLGYVMNMLATWAGGQQYIRKVTVRFRANVVAGERVVANGVVTGLRHGDGRRILADCDVQLVAAGQVALSGTAVVDVTHLNPSEPPSEPPLNGGITP